MTLGAPENGAFSVGLLLFLTRAASLLAPWTEVLEPRLLPVLPEREGLRAGQVPIPLEAKISLIK